MLNFCLFKFWKILIRKGTFIWLQQACSYNFKLSERKTPVLSPCFVRNPNMLKYVLATAITWKKALMEQYVSAKFQIYNCACFFTQKKDFLYKEESEKHFCLGSESIEI